ncbi:MAG: poly-gamma-glutamate system protein [Chlamydiae bacterium]|nr:poly-gamma-glutamate system protein [Chlamydiota bacterium]MBI3277581.1 poly-gamma-glutamate system protein [Chlamydiota bacterium]
MQTTHRVSKITLIGLSIISIFLFLLAYHSHELVRQPWHAEKLKAARLNLVAQNAIKTRAVEKGLVIDAVNDPNLTGLIGQEYTDITTDRGVLKAKLTATNPNFAAVVVDMLKQAGLNKGDVVAVGFTGSMPAMNVAVLAALEALDLKPMMIASVGASTWGATNPDFNWLDIESYLFEKKIFHFQSIAASIGGGRDEGRGLSSLARQLIEDSIRRSGVILIHENSLEESIQKRLELYDHYAKTRSIKAYINVGGGLASLGAAINGRLIPPGLSKNLAMKNLPVKGVVVEMAERGIPVIHLLNIERLARAYGLPIAPQPLPEIGEGRVFFEERHHVMIAVLCTLILIGSITVFVRLDLFHRLFIRRVTRPAL